MTPGKQRSKKMAEFVKKRDAKEERKGYKKIVERQGRDREEEMLGSAFA